MSLKAFITRLPKAFFSKDAYRDVARVKTGSGIAYLAALASVLTLIMMVSAVPGVSGALKKEWPRILEQLPEVQIKNGQVSIDKPEPYFITIMEEPPAYIVVDTKKESGKIEDIFSWMRDQHVVALITKTKAMVQQQERGEIRVYDLSQSQDITITRADWEAFASKAAQWGIPFMILFTAFFLMLGLWLLLMIKALFVAVAGLIIGRIMSVTLDFAGMMRIASMAMVPGLLLKIVENVACIKLGWLPFLVSVGYVGFGLRTLKAAEKPAETPILPPDS